MINFYDQNRDPLYAPELLTQPEIWNSMKTGGINRILYLTMKKVIDEINHDPTTIDIANEYSIPIPLYYPDPDDDLITLNTQPILDVRSPYHIITLTTYLIYRYFSIYYGYRSLVNYFYLKQLETPYLVNDEFKIALFNLLIRQLLIHTNPNNVSYEILTNLFKDPNPVIYYPQTLYNAAARKITGTARIEDIDKLTGLIPAHQIPDLKSYYPRALKYFERN
jgi:hypothetical protein